MSPPLPADNDPNSGFHYGPYFVIGMDGVTKFNVPAHWCNAAWVDFSKSGLSVVNSPEVLAKNHWTFAYGDIGVPHSAPGLTVPYTLMGSSNITLYMPTTGERPDIGLVTDVSAFFLLGHGSAGMLEWAKAGFSIPDQFIDDATGQTIDLLRYPAANNYQHNLAVGHPWLGGGPPNTDPNVGPGRWAPQNAHFPSLWYEAFRATANPAFLWQGQCRATFAFVSAAYTSTQRNSATIIGEQRGTAWSLRDLFAIHAATRDYENVGGKTGSGTPLKPASYWQELLDQTRAYYDVQRTDPQYQIMRFFAPADVHSAPWQQDYCLEALAFGLLTGHREWTDIYLWTLENAISRTNGTSGWPPAYTGYYIPTFAPSWESAFLTGAPEVSGAGPPSADVVAALKTDPMNGGVFLGDANSLYTLRAVLAMALYLDNEGIAPVRATYPEIDACYANAHVLVAKSGAVNPRDSVLPKVST
jgi:hypothetical protein